MSWHPNPFDDQIELKQSGDNTRFRCGDHNVLFIDHSTEHIRCLYDESVALVRQELSARWSAIADCTYSIEEFGRLTQEIALDQMYFYAVNSLPIKVTLSDVNGNQARRLIWWFAESKCGGRTEGSVVLAAGLAGISVSEFEKWLIGYDMHANR